MRTTLSDVFLCVAAATLLIGVQCCRDALDDRAFGLHGKTALAQPVRQVRAVPYERGGQVRSIDYDADFTFTTAAGETVTDRHVRVSASQRDALLAGRRLVLEYLPDDPGKVRFPGWQRQSSTTTWTLLLVSAAAGAAFWFQRKREQRIIREKFGPRRFDGPLRPGDHR